MNKQTNTQKSIDSLQQHKQKPPQSQVEISKHYTLYTDTFKIIISQC